MPNNYNFPVIGPIVRRITRPINKPPKNPGRGGGQGLNASAFEAAIDALAPIAWYRFREPNFNNRIIDSSGNKRHLLKQIAAATRSSVQTRTTHPGGAYFPPVTMTNWATTGTLYKRAAESLLSGNTEYTLLISVRYVDKNTYTAPFKTFGLGTEDAADEFVTIGPPALPSEKTGSEHQDSAAAQRSATTDVTENVWDGVNRLYIVRFKQGVIHRLTTSKPGHIGLTEANGASNVNALNTLSRALVMNGRNANVTGALLTPGFVVDQAALLDYDIGATAETNLHTAWAAELGGYYPAYMTLNGSTGQYTKSQTISATNEITMVCKFKKSSFSGGGVQYIANIGGTAGAAGIFVLVSSDYATADYRDKLTFQSQNGAATNICRLISSSTLADGQDHTVFASYNAATGAATFIVDGVDEDDTGNAQRILTTGTMTSGAGTSAFGSSGGANYFGGSAGFFGVRQAYLTNWSDFMEADGTVKPIDEKNWTEWGAQPLFWSHTGQMSNNKGSAGDMTAAGTITMTVGGSP